MRTASPAVAIVLAAASAFVPVPTVQAGTDALMIAAIACTAHRSKDHSVTCQIEFPDGAPALMLRFRDQAKAMAYGPQAVALFGPIVCDTFGSSPGEQLRLVLVDQSSGAANVYSCDSGNFGGWRPLHTAFR
jgi:hypothetical protein